MNTRTGRRIVVYIAATVIALLLVAFAVLLALSPGRIRPVTDAVGNPVPGSIAEKTHVTVNGTKQGMVIRSADPSNPVLLFVHGGPGMPEYFLDATRPTHLEQEFTVVWWDQRGAGLSYRAGASAPESMTVDELVSDTIAEKTDLWRGKIMSRKTFWDEFINVDMRDVVPRLEVPVYFVHGRDDYTTSYDLARDYFERIDAPAKRFYTFEDSAHSPAMEEPARMLRILREDVRSGDAATDSAHP